MAKIHRMSPLNPAPYPPESLAPRVPTPTVSQPVRAIASMATRTLLAELLPVFEQRSGVAVQLTSIGGVDAARRVMADEAWDVVLLAADALHTLEQAGKLLPGSVQTWVLSDVALAVPSGVALPDISTEAALRQTVLDMATQGCIGYSTGPSGTALLALFRRWGVWDALQARLVQAPPGVAVGTLVARGDVALGFQQRSELLNLPGITLLGPLPPGTQITTAFAAAVVSRSTQHPAARALIDFLASADTAAAKRRHGMAPV